ncbi:transcription factor Tcf25 [Acrasis kona]|uniref:Transcription factor Tcf25 n=1 Tax=Acrasis kona TaxID=1008807 RepID=A0AAW2Z690_9EUKA
MSQRHMKRILEQRQNAAAATSPEEETEEVPTYTVKKQNVFDLLQDDEDNTVEAVASEEEDADISFIKPKKNRKKKKKTADKPKDAPRKQKNDDDDFLEKEMKRVQDIKINSTSIHQQEDQTEVIDFSNLNPQNEFKKLFGTRAVAEGSNQDNRSQQYLPKVIRNNRHHKLHRATGSSSSNGMFVKTKSHWPMFLNLGITCTLTKNKNGSNIYTLDYSGEQYKELQKKYQLAVQSHDPSSFVHLLERGHAYHLHTLVQLSEFYRTIQKEADQAQDMLERGLFALQTILQSNSNVIKDIKTGTARILPYRNHELNQIFYHLLLMRTHAMSRSGAPVSAFEMCKLIFVLSVEKDDPVHVLLFIDFYAIRAAQHDWLCDTLQKLSTSKRLEPFSKLPNLMYNKALAMYYQGKVEEATKAMHEAMLTWPMVLCPLIDECKLSGDKWSQWEKLTRDSIFSNVICNSQVFSRVLSASVKRMSDLYKDLFATYHNDHIVSWLKECAAHVVTVSDVSEYDKIRKDLYDNDLIKKCYAQIYDEEICGNMLPIVVDQTNASGATNAAAANSNPLLFFLQTLLPWNNIPQEVINEDDFDDDDDDEEDQE